jgi:glycosyltransferase involved in cell wall biosynthesis
VSSNISISVALCTFNGKRFLLEQIKSILAQTRMPDEIIVSDDCSNDGSLDLAERLLSSSSCNIKTYRNSRNIGYVKNFEKAISKSTCDITLMCDQDDIWLPKKIEVIEDVFQKNESVGLVLHNFRKIDQYGADFNEELQEFYGEKKLTSLELEDDFSKNSILSMMLPYPRSWYGCMMAFRTRYLPLILPIYPGKGHDDWIMKLLAPISEVKFIADPLILYRIHQSNANSHEVGYSPFEIRFIKSKRKLTNILRGYSKRAFYRSIINRITNGGYDIIHPELIKLYSRYL